MATTPTGVESNLLVFEIVRYVAWNITKRIELNNIIFLNFRLDILYESTKANAAYSIEV